MDWRCESANLMIFRPYCVNNVCSQCNPSSLVPDCGCDPGEYCVTDPEVVSSSRSRCLLANIQKSNVGSCQPFETDIIGRSCQMSLQNDGYKAVTKGENDLLFCGLLKYIFSGTIS